jgi:hypothetical protein
MVSQANNVVVREPLSLDDLLKRGELLIKSGLAPAGIDSPAKAAIIMLKGQELGLQPMQALSDIYVVNGTPSLGTKLMCALYKRAGHSYEITERTADHVTVLFKLKDGSVYRHTVTMAEAEKAKWPYSWDKEKNAWKPKHTWTGMPMVMLTYRCLSTGIRTIAPEILHGMLHQDEAEDALGLEPEMAEADDVVESTARVVEDPGPEEEIDDAPPPTTEPHWTTNDELTGQFLMIKQELGLNKAEVLLTLKNDCGKEIERVGEYPGTYAQAVEALKAFAKAKTSEDGGLI